MNLLSDLQEDFDLTYVFLAHDLGVVRHVSDRIAVMYLGVIVEIGPSDELFLRPVHPYTEALLSAIPDIDGRQPARIRLEGEIPSAVEPPKGCVFHSRCPPRLGPICDETEPPLQAAGPGNQIRCHIPADALPRAAGTAAEQGGEAA